MSFLVILGCHRSGTSALAGVLNAFGFMSGRELIPPNQFNERGYFEDSLVVQQCEALLRELGRSWRDERELPKGWETGEAGLASVGLFGVTLRKSFDLEQPCVLKDPRACRLLPVLSKAFDICGIAPKYVFSLRSPRSVVASLHQRDGLAHQRAALIYVAYLIESERQTRGRPRVFVQYENLLTDWRACLTTIGEELQVPEISSGLYSSDAALRVDQFLTPELNHHRNDEPLGNSRAMQLALSLYECLSLPQGSQSEGVLDALYLEWQQYLGSIEPWLSESIAHENLKESLPSLLWQGGEGEVLFPQQSAASFLHWATEKTAHCGENTRRLTWQFNVNHHRFVLPPISEAITELRWDITESPAYCRVSRFWIESPSGSSIWAWGKGDPLLIEPSPDLGLIGVNDEGELELISLGSDPYGVLRLPPSVLVQLQEGWSICVDWIALVPNQGIKPTILRISKLLASLGDTQSELQRAEQRFETLRCDSESESRALQELREQRKVIRAEILRAEAQIEMLKDLFVSVDKN